ELHAGAVPDLPGLSLHLGLTCQHPRPAESLVLVRANARMRTASYPAILAIAVRSTAGRSTPFGAGAGRETRSRRRGHVMQIDDTDETAGLTGSGHSEMRDVRNGKIEDDHGFITRDHRRQREVAPAQPAVTSSARGKPTMATVSSRTEQFLVAKKSGALPQDAQPFDLASFEQTLKAGGIGACTHTRTLTRSGRGTPWSIGGAAGEAIIVAAMPHDIAAQLRQHPGLIVEPDQVLSYAQQAVSDAQPALLQDTPLSHDPQVVRPYGMGFTASITVMGEGGIPLEGAAVYLYGKWWPAQGLTDARGRVQL